VATLRATQFDARIIDAGCCAIAGAFGFDKTAYRISLDIGERALLPAGRQASDDTAVVADGFSCREQISQATGRGRSTSRRSSGESSKDTMKTALSHEHEGWRMFAVALATGDEAKA
jgi:Fe-S oxidoreductase